MLSPSFARAQTHERLFLHTELAFTTPIGEPEIDHFGPGGSAAVGVFHSLHPIVALGVQARASFFSDNQPPVNPLFQDEGVGGLYTISLAARVRPFGQHDDPARATGPFLELSFGGAITEDLPRPAMEVGLGWGIPLGPIDLTPAIRYQHVFHEGPLQPEDGSFLLLGLGVTFLDGRAEPEEEPDPEVGAEPEPRGPIDACPDEPEDLDGFEDEDGCPDPDNDGDGILDVRDACPDEPETVNGVNDQDGCPDTERPEVINDRVVLGEAIFFDYDGSELRTRGHEILRELAGIWNRNPEWVGMIIEGHADARGSAGYNRSLSLRRAETVRDALVSFGLRIERIELRARGEQDPEVPNADNERDYQLNRRVEFIVVRASAGADVSERPHPDSTVEN